MGRQSEMNDNLVQFKKISSEGHTTLRISNEHGAMVYSWKGIKKTLFFEKMNAKSLFSIWSYWLSASSCRKMRTETLIHQSSCECIGIAKIE